MGGSSGSAGSGRQRSGPRLLLRFCLPELPADEIYVTRKLTIGRTPDNVCVINEPEVDRHHAVVDFREGEQGGQFVVRCIQPGGCLDVDGQPMRELVLQPGVRFKVGSGQFECLAAPQVSVAAPERDWSACPGCAGSGCLNLPEGMGRCPDCGHQVVALSDGRGQRVVLPVEVKPCRLVRLVGQGAMAWVFEARLEGRAEPVAVKVLMPHLLADEAALQRFRREIQVLQEVRHPRVLRRLGQGKWKGLPCLLTPLMPNGSLRQVIEQNPRREPMCDFRTAFGWLLDVIEGLRALHAAGLVHRDLKPSNVLLDADWRAVVADLGIARRVGGQTDFLTATGATVGTYHYMAPEQFDNPEAVDHRADQYALGVMFYELLTGRLPRGSWQPPSEINPTVPPAFDAVLERLLSPQPEGRYQSLQALIDELSSAGLMVGRGNSGGGQQGVIRRAISQARDVFQDKTVRRYAGLAIGVAIVAILGFYLLLDSARKEPSRDQASRAEQSRNESTEKPSQRTSPAIQPTLPTNPSETESTGNERLVIAAVPAMSAVTSVCFSPDGRQVLTGSDDNTARLWDAATGQELRRFEGHTLPVWSVCFSPDGRQVLTGSSDKTVRLWDGHRPPATPV